MKRRKLPETVLTPEELFKRWKKQISIGTLANWRSEGYGPKYVKLGKKVVYPLVEIVKFEIDQTRQSTDL